MLVEASSPQHHPTKGSLEKPRGLLPIGASERGRHLTCLACSTQLRPWAAEVSTLLQSTCRSGGFLLLGGASQIRRFRSPSARLGRGLIVLVQVDPAPSDRKLPTPFSARDIRWPQPSMKRNCRRLSRYSRSQGWSGC